MYKLIVPAEVTLAVVESTVSKTLAIFFLSTQFDKRHELMLSNISDGVIVASLLVYVAAGNVDLG